jgi:hypothetical protein
VIASAAIHPAAGLRLSFAVATLIDDRTITMLGQSCQLALWVRRAGVFGALLV